MRLFEASFWGRLEKRSYNAMVTGPDIAIDNIYYILHNEWLECYQVGKPELSYTDRLTPSSAVEQRHFR